MSEFSDLENALQEWTLFAIRHGWSGKDLWYKCQYFVAEDERGYELEGPKQYLRGFCDAYRAVSEAIVAAREVQP